MEKKHTPLPWSYEERCSGIAISAYTDEPDDEKVVAMILPDDEDDLCDDEDDANAELIVRAVNNHAVLVDELRNSNDMIKRLLAYEAAQMTSDPSLIAKFISENDQVLRNNKAIAQAES